MLDEQKTREELIFELKELRRQTSTDKHLKILNTLRTRVGEISVLLDLMPAYIFIKDTNHVAVTVNKKFSDAMGLTKGDIIGKATDELFPKDVAEKYIADDKTVIETGEQLVIEEEFIDQGRSVKVETRKVPLKDHNGSVIGILGLAFDITELKRTEEALRESERSLKNIFKCIQDGISVLDTELNIVHVNQVMEKWYGEDLAGKKCYQVYHGRREPCERCPTIRALRDKTMHKEALRDRQGWREIYVFPLVNEAGEVTGVIEHVRNIDDRKRHEQALKDTKRQAELYLDLMGHDINNMHQVALGYLEMIRDMKLVDESYRDLVDKPIEALQRSAELIKNVRTLQMLHDGSFHTETIDLNVVLAGVQSEFMAMPNKRVTLRVHGNEHCRVRANALIHDVFLNLVSNAIKYTGDKADISISLERVDVNEDHYYKISVEDNGPGIPDDLKGKIFNRMLRGTSKVKGMGLGLYLVKSLVESYHGKVWVEDRIAGEHTKGSRFVVLLPTIDKY